jgi:hypothetical protein
MSGKPRLLILPEHWHDLGYRYQEVWGQIQALDAARATFILTPADLQAVHADRWALTLTPWASARLKEQFGRTYLDALVFTKAVFVAAVGKVKLFGGVFTEVCSAAAIRFPVIYPDIAQDPLVLYVRPVHECLEFTPEHPGAADLSTDRTPDLAYNRDAIRSFFGQLAAEGKRRTLIGLSQSSDNTPPSLER